MADPTQRSPGDWGTSQLLCLLDIFEFSLLLCSWVLILIPVVRYLLQQFRSHTCATSLQLCQVIHDRWSYLQLSALSGLQLLSIRDNGENGMVQYIRCVFSQHRLWHASWIMLTFAVSTAFLLYLTLVALSLAAILVKVTALSGLGSKTLGAWTPDDVSRFIQFVLNIVSFIPGHQGPTLRTALLLAADVGAEDSQAPHTPSHRPAVNHFQVHEAVMRIESGLIAEVVGDEDALHKEKLSGSVDGFRELMFEVAMKNQGFLRAMVILHCFSGFDLASALISRDPINTPLPVSSDQSMDSMDIA